MLSASIYLLFCVEVDHDSGKTIWPKHCTDYLLASPQNGRLENCWGRQIDELICISEPGKDLSELLASEEDVSAGNEEGCREEILDESDDGFTTLRGDYVLSDSHEV